MSELKKKTYAIFTHCFNLLLIGIAGYILFKEHYRLGPVASSDTDTDKESAFHIIAIIFCCLGLLFILRFLFLNLFQNRLGNIASEFLRIFFSISMYVYGAAVMFLAIPLFLISVFQLFLYYIAFDQVEADGFLLLFFSLSAFGFAFSIIYNFFSTSKFWKS